MAVERERVRKKLSRASEAAIDELQAWCEAHPRYRLLEFEEEVRAVRQRLMAHADPSQCAPFTLFLYKAILRRKFIYVQARG